MFPKTYLYLIYRDISKQHEAAFVNDFVWFGGFKTISIFCLAWLKFSLPVVRPSAGHATLWSRDGLCLYTACTWRFFSFSSLGQRTKCFLLILGLSQQPEELTPVIGSGKPPSFQHPPPVALTNTVNLSHCSTITNKEITLAIIITRNKMCPCLHCETALL